MGKKIEVQFEECLAAGKIRKFPKAKSLATKELRVAEGDLRAARAGLEACQWKWSTIQAYYSMFHASRALLYSAGYREKSHHCLRVALEALFVAPGLLPEKFTDALQTGRTMRENADYEESFSEAGARKLVSLAHEFLSSAGSLLKKGRP